MALENYAVHDALLSQVAVDYAQNLAGLVGLQVIPGQRADAFSGRFPKAKKEILGRVKPEAIGPASQAIVIRQAGFDYVNFTLEPYAARISVTELERLWAGYSLPGVDLRVRGTEMLAQVLQVWFEEQLWAGIETELVNASRNTDHDGVNILKWTDQTTDPVQDIEDTKANLLQRPNVMVVSYKVYQTLRNHAAVKDRIKYTQIARPANAAELAALFDVERFLVADWKYWDGTQFVPLHSDHAWLLYVEPAQPFTRTAFFYLWNGATLFEVFRWVDPATGAKSGTEWIKNELTISSVQVGVIENAWVRRNVI